MSPEMYLVELFLPLADDAGTPFSREQHRSVERQLTEQFGGVTAYPRAPASGRWKQTDAEQQQDDFIVYEVMTEKLDKAWWLEYREQLEAEFRQERLLVRAQSVSIL